MNEPLALIGWSIAILVVYLTVAHWVKQEIHYKVAPALRRWLTFGWPIVLPYKVVRFFVWRITELFTDWPDDREAP